MSASPATPVRRRLRWLLLASLAGNLVLLVVLVSVLQRPPRAWEPVMPSPRMLGRVLPEAHQPMFEEVLAAHRPALREAMRERRELRRDLRQLLQAEPFPRGELEQRLETLRLRDGGVSAAAHALLLDTLERLPVADRRQVVEQMYASRHRHREHRHRDAESRPVPAEAESSGD